MKITKALAVLAAILVNACQSKSVPARWVTSIKTSPDWAVFLCTDYLITNACSTAKDYPDPGELPTTISLGDIIEFRDKEGEVHTFTVRAITFFVFDADMDMTWKGERLTARKGETTCSIYETEEAKRSSDYLSKIIVKQCALPT